MKGKLLHYLLFIALLSTMFGFSCESEQMLVDSMTGEKKISLNQPNNLGNLGLYFPGKSEGNKTLGYLHAENNPIPKKIFAAGENIVLELQCSLPPGGYTAFINWGKLEADFAKTKNSQSEHKFEIKGSYYYVQSLLWFQSKDKLELTELRFLKAVGTWKVRTVILGDKSGDLFIREFSFQIVPPKDSQKTATAFLPKGQ